MTWVPCGWRLGWRYEKFETLAAMAARVRELARQGCEVAVCPTRCALAYGKPARRSWRPDVVQVFGARVRIP